MKKFFYLVLAIPLLFSCAKEKDSYAFEEKNEKVRKVEYEKTDIEDNQKNSSEIQTGNRALRNCFKENCSGNIGVICSSFYAYNNCTFPAFCTCLCTSVNFDDVMADLSAILGVAPDDIEEFMLGFEPDDLNGDAVIYINNLLASY